MYSKETRFQWYTPYCNLWPEELVEDVTFSEYEQLKTHVNAWRDGLFTFTPDTLRRLASGYVLYNRRERVAPNRDSSLIWPDPMA